MDDSKKTVFNKIAPVLEFLDDFIVDRTDLFCGLTHSKCTEM